MENKFYFIYKKEIREKQHLSFLSTCHSTSSLIDFEILNLGNAFDGPLHCQEIARNICSI